MLATDQARRRAGRVVGLDIEAGSIAAAEVQVERQRPSSTAAGDRSRSPPGAFHEGEVVDPDASPRR